MSRAIFMGSDEFSAPILERLLREGPHLDSPVRIVAVIAKPDRASGRGRKTSAGPVKRLADDHACDVFQPETLRDAKSRDRIAEFRPNLIVVASYGQILPRALLEMAPAGCLNLHPSLLPRHRGPNPIGGAILHGDQLTGTTLMVMTPKMDSGPIVNQRKTAIGRHETAGELAQRLAEMSADLLLEELPRWLGGDKSATPQAESHASYTKLVEKSDGLIDWTKDADSIARQVRACNPWPMAFSFWDGRQIRILRAQAVSGESCPGEVTAGGEEMRIGTGEGFLEVEQIQLSGKKPATIAEFLRGHARIVGANLKDHS